MSASMIDDRMRFEAAERREPQCQFPFRSMSSAERRKKGKMNAMNEIQTIWRTSEWLTI